VIAHLGAALDQVRQSEYAVHPAGLFFWWDG
jgi:hypothetical protein